MKTLKLLLFGLGALNYFACGDGVLETNGFVLFIYPNIFLGFVFLI